jgi:hypothetical protein
METSMVNRARPHLDCGAIEKYLREVLAISYEYLLCWTVKGIMAVVRKLFGFRLVDEN